MPKNKILIFSSRIPEYGSEKAVRYFAMLKSLVNELEVHYLSFQTLFLDEKSLKEMKDIGVKVKDLKETEKPVSFEKRLADFLAANKYCMIMFDSVYTAKYYLPFLRKYSDKSILIMDARNSQYLMELKFVEMYKDDSKKSTMLAKSIITSEKELPIYSYFDILLVSDKKQAILIKNDLPNLVIEVLDNKTDAPDQEAVKKIFSKSSKKKSDIDSAAKSTEIIRHKFSENEDLVRCYNDYLSACEKDHLIIIPEDAEVADYTLEALHVCMAVNSKNAIVAPASNLYIENNSKGNVPPPENEKDYAEFLDKHFIGNYAEWRRPTLLMEPVFLIRRSVIDKVGILDKKLRYLHYALFDYCFRIRQAGFNILLNQEAFVFYRSLDSNFNKFSSEDQEYLNSKWGIAGAEILESLGEKIPR